MIWLVLEILIGQLAIFYTMGKMFDEKINLKCYQFYLYFLVSSVIPITSIYVNFGIIKPFFMFANLVLLCKLYYDKSYRDSVINCIITQILLIFSELFSLAFYLLININSFNDKVDFSKMDNPKIEFLLNIVSILILIIFSKMNWVKKIYEYMLKITDKLSNGYIINFLISIFILIATFVLIYIDNVANYSFFIVFIVIIVLMLYLILSNIEISNKYITSRNKYYKTNGYLQEYSKIIDQNRIQNHEHRNQLMIIRSMARDRSSDIYKYLNSLLGIRYKDDKNVIYKLSFLPFDKISALICSKAEKMNNLKIKYEISIDPSFKNYKGNDLPNKDNIDITRILSVFIDNAIDEISKDKKEYVYIDVFYDPKKIIVDVTNHLIDDIDLDMIDEKNYSTKGKNRGYGLTLVSQILETNKKLTSTRKITNGMFTQTLEIKIKDH